MIIFITIPIIILIILNLIIIYSLRNPAISSKNDTNLVNISIIIAAKDEESNICSLLTSIQNLDYPAEMFEVIIVDDHSTDNTFIKLKEQSEKVKNLRIIKLSFSEKSGKRNALSCGVNNAKYHHILITDADCYPDPAWLKAYSQLFNSGYEMLFGAAPFYQNENKINKISCFENLRNSLLSFAFAALGLPYTAAARNFGFTKRAFDSIGGYTNTKDTLSGDDDLLLREAVKRKIKIGTVIKPGSFVYSRTKESLKEYLMQRARHTQTSVHYLTKHKLFLGTWHLINLVFVASIFLALINPLWGILFASKMTTDMAVVKLKEKKFGYHFKPYEIILLQISYELLLIINFFNSRFKEIKWK